MISLATRIDRFTAALGRAVAWLALGVVLAQFALMLARYGFGAGSLWLSEGVIYAHAALFLLAAAWTLSSGGHVRVDIFYAHAGPRRRAWVDLNGTLVFLLPFAVMLFMLSWPYAARSWAILEGSRESSGLPLVFVLKSFIPAFAVLMVLQGVAQAIKAVAVLQGTAHVPR